MARVLVVDDEPDILLLHRLNLEAAGHEVLLAADGMKALERITADTPDVVVLVVMLPVLDGWGVLDRLAAVVTAPPVLVVSAKSARADVAQAVNSGAADFLAKPFNPDALIQALNRLLNASQADREARRQELLR
jgi:two-component system alkaline phosphatase synthesis response regulator PhoP